MSPMVVSVSREQLTRRRANVLARVGLTEPELRAKAEIGALTSDEWDAVDILDRVAFLLADPE